jgi:diaminopimelate decarboxylase/aspartate kinase
LLATGEWLSTQIGTRFLRQQGLDAAWVDAREALEATAEHDLSPSRQWLSASCLSGKDPALASLWSGVAPVLVTQGFVARNAEGRTVLLGRGGSDTGRALAGRLMRCRWRSGATCRPVQRRSAPRQRLPAG